MTDHGHTLAADLSELQAAAKLSLPDLAYTYGKLNREVADTSSNDGSAFTPCPNAGSVPSAASGYDAVYPGWTDLRDRLRNHLGKSSQHLEAAGHALEHIVKAYAATDSTAASDLHDAWKKGIPDSLKHQSKNQRNEDKLPPEPPNVVVD